MGPVIEIFRAGEHTAMDGRLMRFTLDDLQAIADAFDPEETPVPIVVGHPKTDHPAYAWAETVSRNGDVLVASLKDIDPNFAELVKAKRYKRISSAFFHPAATNNPTPGQYSLRHIGFLGAAAPAVKGLKSVAFSDSEADWLVFSGPNVTKVDKRTPTLIRLVQNERDLERLIDQGKVLPCEKDELLAFMVSLDDSMEVAFSDSGETQTLSEWFRKYLGRTPQIVPMGKVVPPVDSDLENAQFAAPEGHKVDHSNMDLHARASQIMREKGVRFEDAVEMVHGN